MHGVPRCLPRWRQQQRCGRDKDVAAEPQGAWQWPLDPAAYDRSPALTLDEATALTALVPRLRTWRTRRGAEWETVDRLVCPLADARAAVEVRSRRQASIADKAVA